jgi:hypothetical protein
MSQVRFVQDALVLLVAERYARKHLSSLYGLDVRRGISRDYTEALQEREKTADGPPALLAGLFRILRDPGIMPLLAKQRSDALNELDLLAWVLRVVVFHVLRRLPRAFPFLSRHPKVERY